MNKTILMGRMTKDAELKYTTGENSTAIARFNIAVTRNFKNKDGEYDSDFISCFATGRTAEFISKFFNKGDMIAVCGSIRTGSYTNTEGRTIYTTDVNVNEAFFCGGKKKNSEEKVEDTSSDTSVDDNWTTQSDEEELPF